MQVDAGVEQPGAGCHALNQQVIDQQALLKRDVLVVLVHIAKQTIQSNVLVFDLMDGHVGDQ